MGLLSLFITFPFEEEKNDEEEGETATEEQAPIRARPGEVETSLKDTFFSLKKLSITKFLFLWIL